MPLRNNGTSRGGGWLRPTLIKQESKYKIRIEERDSELSFFALVAVTGGVGGGKNPAFFPLCVSGIVVPGTLITCLKTMYDRTGAPNKRSRNDRHNRCFSWQLLPIKQGNETGRGSRKEKYDGGRGEGELVLLARVRSSAKISVVSLSSASCLTEKWMQRGTFTRANAREPRTYTIARSSSVCPLGVRGVEYARICMYRDVDARAKEDETCKSRSARATRRDENMRKRRAHAGRGLKKRREGGRGKG